MSFTEAIQKLNDMLSKRFDVKVQFISSEANQPSEIVYFETVRRNASAPLIITHNNMLIPVRAEGSLTGAIRVSEISEINHIDLSRIKETIDRVLEENFLSKTLPMLPTFEEIESKVLPFRFPSNRMARAN